MFVIVVYIGQSFYIWPGTNCNRNASCISCCINGFNYWEWGCGEVWGCVSKTGLIPQSAGAKVADHSSQFHPICSLCLYICHVLVATCSPPCIKDRDDFYLIIWFLYIYIYFIHQRSYLANQGMALYTYICELKVPWLPTHVSWFLDASSTIISLDVCQSPLVLIWLLI